MAKNRYQNREEAFAQLDRLVGTWVDDGGGESTYEWMQGGRNFMVQKLGKDGEAGLEVIGYDAASGQLKSSFYATNDDMLDNDGQPICYIYFIDGEDMEIALDTPARDGSFVGKLTQGDTHLAGRWDWTQNGEKMGYDWSGRKK